MKKLPILLFTLLIGVFLSFQLSSCGNGENQNQESTTHEHEQMHEEEHHNHEGHEHGSTSEAAGEKWVCPMGCEGDLVHDKPGTCSVCGMELKKVEE